MSFESPLWFLTLFILLPLFVLYRRKRREYLSFTLEPILRGIEISSSAVYRIPWFAFVLSLILLIIALAGPTKGEKIIKEVERIKTIDIVLDTSGSMSGGYLDAGIETIRDFLEKKAEQNQHKLNERVGLYLFGNNFKILQMPTVDAELLFRQHGQLNLTLAQGGTEPIVAFSGLLNLILNEAFEKLDLSKEQKKTERTYIFSGIKDSSKDIYVPDIEFPAGFIPPAHSIVFLSDEKFSTGDYSLLKRFFEFIENSNENRFLNVKVFMILIGSDSQLSFSSSRGDILHYNVNNLDYLDSLFNEIQEQEVSEVIIKVVTSRKSVSWYFALSAFVLFILAWYLKSFFLKSVP